MPIFSLPSPYGIGTMGAAGRNFVDFLAAGGQRCWQILPMGPTGYGDSPYQSFSAYAGNPYFIDLDTLCAQGLLLPQEYQSLDWGEGAGVDYERLYHLRIPVLRLACARLNPGHKKAFAAFCKQHRIWLEDYALFMALKQANQGAPWHSWSPSLRGREASALAQARAELAGEVAFWMGMQYLFFQQWEALKAYANGKGVSIIGDVPIYVAADSADVWANQEQFQLAPGGLPTLVAGCPPDGFTADGQLWGNPLFHWERMKQEGYRWWLDRLRFQFGLCDTLRIDHFRGFDAYYAIPYGQPTARDGQWLPGPGQDFFRALNRRLGRRDIIAEDLGFLTDSVHHLLKKTGYPGMKVLQFAFGSMNEDSDYLPHRYPKRCVVYPGTHDNDTIVGWLAAAPTPQANFAKAYLRLSRGEGYHWGAMRAAWGSPADLAVVQLQDVLGLGSGARMNIPSTLGGNWTWRCGAEELSPRLARRLHREMAVFQRLAREENP